ncbi:MAG: sigma 54-interacting transcriptional regulator [Candidatus Hydrothermae bacterium]|nr:sigma 54-interacting transcriptional regulator [Candidatus Hydrothermae bacterium]
MSCLLEDGQEIFTFLSRMLGERVSILRAEDYREARFLLKTHPIRLVILDQNFAGTPPEQRLGRNPETEGLRILERLRKEFADLPILILTTYPDPRHAERALHLGASDYLEWDALVHEPDMVRDRILHLIGASAEDHADSPFEELEALLGRHAHMQQVYRELLAHLKGSVPLVLVGERGVGKESLARWVHRSTATSGPFQSIRILAIPPHRVEEELFREARGSAPPGVLHSTQGGVVYVEDLVDFSPTLQGLLMAWLEGTYWASVSSGPATSRPRLILGSSRPLKDLQQEGGLRKDLLDLLEPYEIRIPPLRDRPEDVEHLVREYLQRFAQEQNRDPTPITVNALGVLKAYPWPGNLSELLAVLQECLYRAEGRVIRMIHVMEVLKKTGWSDLQQSPLEDPTIYRFLTSHTLREIEELAIQAVLRETDFNKRQAAERLGIGVSTLYQKLRSRSEESSDDRGSR